MFITFFDGYSVVTIETDDIVFAENGIAFKDKKKANNEPGHVVKPTNVHHITHTDGNKPTDKYEYHMTPNNGDPKHEIEMMDMMGQDGWQLCHILGRHHYWMRKLN
jgi:hypothetical protein